MKNELYFGLISDFLNEKSNGNWSNHSPLSDEILFERMSLKKGGTDHIFQCLGSKAGSMKVAGIWIDDEPVSNVYYFEYLRQSTTDTIEFSFKKEVKALNDIQALWEERLQVQFASHNF